MTIIEKIREEIEIQNKKRNMCDMEIPRNMILEHYGKDKAELVFEDTVDDGDRWLMDEVEVYKITEGAATAYFKITKAVGRTEQQSDGGIDVVEVEPKVVTVTNYEEIE